MDINGEEVEEQAKKKVKKAESSSRTRKTKTKVVKQADDVCDICHQKLDDVKFYMGHPNNAHDEYSVLLNEKLCLFRGDESDITEGDVRALNKVTDFSVYDKNGHLVQFDEGLIERNVNIYFSGYVKPIYDDDPSIEGGIPGKDLGPIVEWWVTGFDGGEHSVLSFSTEIGDYVLLKPSEEYAPFTVSVREKTFLSKKVIEFLLEEENLEYEDLLNKLETVAMPQGLPRFTQDILIHYAQFICDQIISFDESATKDDPLIIKAPCIRTLIDLAGITFQKGKSVLKNKKSNINRQDENWRKGLMEKVVKDKNPSISKVTMTALVNNTIDSFIQDQLPCNNSDKLASKRRRHGVSKSKSSHMEIQDDEDSLEADEEAEPSLIVYRKKFGLLKRRVNSVIEWVDEPIQNDARGSFYRGVTLDSEVIRVNDYVYIQPIDSTLPLQIVKVIYMWEDKKNVKMFHATWLWRGSETVVGKTLNHQELFLVDECQDVPIEYIKSKTSVIYKNIPDNWSEMGDVKLDLGMNESKEDINSFFYQKRYNPTSARFEDPLPDIECKPEVKYRFCSTCTRCSCIQLKSIPQVYEKIEERSSEEVLYSMVKCNDEEFRVGSAVYLQPKTFEFKYPLPHQNSTRVLKEEIDEDKYPEYYRKSNDCIKGTNFDTSEPFEIGYITCIYATTNVKLLASINLNIKVKKLYRPENTHKAESLKQRSDINLLYWSEEEVTIPFSAVTGKCYLAYAENLDKSVEEWTSAGPNRFYFSQMYISENEEFDDPPPKACHIGKSTKRTDKLKSKSKKIENLIVDIPPEYPAVEKKLRMLDVFAGCGGLSEGLKEAGIAESKWAIELDEAAANAYRLNNPNAIVFTGDCNVILKKVMNGEKTIGIQHLPQKGEVDLLCGGPPCQGFSSMNGFNSRAFLLFKNSPVVSYLSYCDYYRPRYFIMENVRNFVTYGKSTVLKFTLSCLMQMGYQCTFGVLQAGNFGVPQACRRMFVLGAAPGEILPRFPEALHVFSLSECNLNVVVDEKKYFQNYHWTESAPYKVTTVWDAISDLPYINSGKNEDIISYDSEPLSYFQTKMRKGVHLLQDHICKDLGPLVEARVAHIPTVPGSDWRDLPNIEITLSDQTCTNKLKYNYHDKKAGKSSTGALRGVCVCCTGKYCNPFDRQDNTLIPWCLSHTANKHNQWAGLYGRIEWDGFFRSTITNPEPMNKQGQVIHPEQTRVVSVRECARSQGFPDNFRFYGNILDKYKQVGNAVPPPLAFAIGMEIRKCVNATDLKRIKIVKKKDND